LFLPISDAPNPPGRPLVTWGLIGLNVAIYLLATAAFHGAADPAHPLVQEYMRGAGRSVLSPGLTNYDVFVFEYGFRPAHASALTLLTSMFLHGGLFHLAGNMLFLWIFGDNVEHRLGRLGYLAAYLGTGAAATLFFAAMSRGSDIPLVGASGAISGVMGFYFLLFPRNVVNVFVLFFVFIQVIRVPARVVLGGYIILSNILPALAQGNAGPSGVAYGAHIGGFFAGLGAAFLVDRRERESRPREFREARGHRAAAARRPSFADLVASGRLSDAADTYFATSDHILDRESPREVLVLGRWLSESGKARAALSAFRRVLASHPSGTTAADAHLGAGLVQLRNLQRPTSAYQHFLDVIDLEPGSEAAAIAREGIDFIERSGGGRP
jgi:membrane associated rhomboid family serine protease